MPKSPDSFIDYLSCSILHCDFFFKQWREDLHPSKTRRSRSNPLNWLIKFWSNPWDIHVPNPSGLLGLREYWSESRRGCRGEAFLRLGTDRPLRFSKLRHQNPHKPLRSLLVFLWKKINDLFFSLRGYIQSWGSKNRKIFLLHILKVHTFENICVKFHPDRSTRFQMTAVRSALVLCISTWRAASNVRLSWNRVFWKIPLRWTWYLKNFSTDFHNFFLRY